MELNAEIEAMYIALKLGDNQLKRMSLQQSDAQTDILAASIAVERAIESLAKWIDPKNISIIYKERM